MHLSALRQCAITDGGALSGAVPGGERRATGIPPLSSHAGDVLDERKLGIDVSSTLSRRASECVQFIVDERGRVEAESINILQSSHGLLSEAVRARRDQQQRLPGWL